MNPNWFTIDNNPPKITDWVQATGALIAIIAAIIGFVKLFRRDKKREQEIASLTAIAGSQQQNLEKMQSLLEESQKQTLEFSIQTGEMRESNKLYRDHLLLLSQAMTDTKTYNDQLIAMKNAERKNEILPRFRAGGESRSNTSLSLQLQLVRNTAYFDSYHDTPGTGITLQAQLAKGKIVGTNETIALKGQITGPLSIVMDYQPSPVVIGEIRFKNEDGDLYRQVISHLGTGFEIGKPEEISNQRD